MTRHNEPGQKGSSPPQARKYDAASTRTALLRAAALRFGRFGYDGTSVRGIARDAGVDAALVYRYFGSKQALFDTVTLSTEPFEPLRRLPLDQVSRWVYGFILATPGKDQGHHPILTLLRSPTRQDPLGRLRSNVTEVFSENFANRLDGPDTEVRAELLAACILGLTLMRQAVQAPALASASESTLLRYLPAMIDPLLNRPPQGPRADKAAPAGR